MSLDMSVKITSRKSCWLGGGWVGDGGGGVGGGGGWDVIPPYPSHWAGSERSRGSQATQDNPLSVLQKGSPSL